MVLQGTYAWFVSALARDARALQTGWQPLIETGRRDVAEKIVLITGVTGQDGAYLSRLLLDKGYVVI